MKIIRTGARNGQKAKMWMWQISQSKKKKKRKRKRKKKRDKSSCLGSLVLINATRWALIRLVGVPLGVGYIRVRTGGGFPITRGKGDLSVKQKNEPRGSGLANAGRGVCSLEDPIRRVSWFGRWLGCSIGGAQRGRQVGDQNPKPSRRARFQERIRGGSVFLT